MENKNKTIQAEIARATAIIEKKFPPSKQRDKVVEAIKAKMLKDAGVDSEEFEINEEPEPKIIKYFDGKSILDAGKKIKETLKKDIAEVKKQIPVIPKQMTKRDVESIVKPLIPEIPEMPEIPAPQVIPDLVAERKDIEALKKEQAKLEKKIDEVQITAQSSTSKGSVSDRGGRFANKGAPDRHGYSDAGSFGSAIPDNRYAQLKNLRSLINLSSQCDGSTTNFDLGQSVSGILFVNLSGTILIDDVDFSLNADNKGLTLVFAPETGEQLYVKII